MKTILIVRKKDIFSRIMAANGYEIINLPLIETKPLRDLRDFELKVGTIKSYDGVFLTSAKAAEIFRAKLIESKTNYDGKIYVLGGRGFDVLKTENLDLVFFDEANTAREMLKKIPPEDLKGKRFLFVRGEKSLRVVPEYIERLAEIDETIVYETRNIAIEIDKVNFLREQFVKGEIAAVCFFSPSGAESFIKQFGAEILHQTRIATIGKTTAEFFGRQNVKVDFVSSRSNAGGFAAELVVYLDRIYWSE